MYRSHTCGELRLGDTGKEVTLSGWVQKSRDLGGMTFVDLRDRYGITQLVFNMESNADLCTKARKLGREFVIQIKGEVAERSSKNKNISTGEIEINVSELNILNASKTPPFTIENETDGGDDLRMQYRYLDLRRNPVRQKLELRNKLNIASRNYLDSIGFMDIETPYLIKSTPEGARDFVVPSRMNPGQFYALPQSPQTFKQLLMVSGYDKYYQIVKCFRDEDLRADRQPEFTQIDCEMSFVEQEDVLNTFEGMVRHLFKEVKGIEVQEFPRMTFDEAMRRFGNDKPDLRFGMEFCDFADVAKNKGFNVFDSAEAVLGIVAEGCGEYSRKQLDALTDWVKRPQIGAKGLVYVKCNEDGSFKSSVDKFFDQDALKAWADHSGAKAGDLMLLLSGDLNTSRKQLSELRLHMGRTMGLMNPDEFKPLWVIDFPLLEWDEDTARYHAMHHPFTSPKPEHMDILESDPGAVRANAYDMVINGVEIGGGSIRIHDRAIQSRMFDLLGFSKSQAQEQFGFLMNAFEYGAPPHGGLALGFDRLCALFGGSESIRDFIAFPKNSNGRDQMIKSPSRVDDSQLEELKICVKQQIYDATGPGPNYAFWFPILIVPEINIPSAHWYLQPESYFICHGDGEAVLKGKIYNSESPNLILRFNLVLENQADWATWSALGRSFEDPLNCAIPDGRYEDWHYYELCTEGSFIIGEGDLEGLFIEVTHTPDDYEFGFQYGSGANTRNCNFGLSGKFNYFAKYGNFKTEGPCEIAFNVIE